MSGNNTSNIINSFTESVSNLVISTILPVISYKCEQKGIKYSVEEMTEDLCRAVNLPKPHNNSNGVQIQMPNMPNIPSFLKGTGAATPSSAKGAGRGRGRKKVEVATTVMGKTCSYEFTRGGRQGNLCGEPVVDGTDYCKDCLKKKNVQQKMGKGPTVTSSLLHPPTIPNTLVQTGQIPKQKQQEEHEKEIEIEVSEIEGRPGLYREMQHNFIIQQSPNGTLLAIKISDNGVERDLTDEEKKTAVNMGLAVIHKPVDTSDDMTEEESEGEGEGEGEEDMKMDNAEDGEETISNEVKPTLPQVPVLP